MLFITSKVFSPFFCYAFPVDKTGASFFLPAQNMNVLRNFGSIREATLLIRT